MTMTMTQEAPEASTIGVPASRRILTAAVLIALHHLGGSATVTRLAAFTHLQEYNLYRICKQLAETGLLQVSADERPMVYAIPGYEAVRSTVRKLCSLEQSDLGEVA